MRGRPLQMGYAALTTALAVTLGGCAQGSRALTTVPVAVTVQCTPNRAFIKVDPWVVQLHVGDSVSWTLTQRPPPAASTVFSLDVAAEQGEQWPFAGGKPTHGNRTSPARSGGPANANAKGHHRYTITAICGTEDQPGQTVVIDPDMDIM